MQDQGVISIQNSSEPTMLWELEMRFKAKTANGRTEIKGADLEDVVEIVKGWFNIVTVITEDYTKTVEGLPFT